MSGEEGKRGYRGEEVTCSKLKFYHMMIEMKSGCVASLLGGCGEQYCNLAVLLQFMVERVEGGSD